eukprot:12966951-Heterocapsa_arctica.AAC.1
MVPQEVVPEYVGPRLSGGQELSRLFATPARVCPRLTQEDLPRLPKAKGGHGPQEVAGRPQTLFDQGLRPRSRSPRPTVWTG